MDFLVSFKIWGMFCHSKALHIGLHGLGFYWSKKKKKKKMCAAFSSWSAVAVVTATYFLETPTSVQKASRSCEKNLKKISIASSVL